MNKDYYGLSKGTLVKVSGVELANIVQKANTRMRIVDALLSTDRDGIKQLVEWLVTEGFFEAPASTKHHGVYPGGLAQHSLNVMDLLRTMTFRIVPLESIVIAALLHDVCKVGAYILKPETGIFKPEYSWNRDQPKGHAVLSIERIGKFIKLTEIEDLMIRYHMGVYGLKEFDPGKGEYPLCCDGGLAGVWEKHPIVKLMYFADELVTMDEKRAEG